MSDDPLFRATRALREETKPAAPDLERVRARVMATSLERRRRTSSRWVVALPLAAALAATTAFAATGGRGARLVAAVEAMFAAEPVAAPAPAPAPSPAPAPQPVPMPDPAPVIASAPSAASAPSPTVAPTRAEPDDARGRADLDAYRRAHDLHFRQGDCTQAVAAWDAYLAAWPTGTFAPEAGYNRGVCLARLGRKDDARAALRPYADGRAAGGYRRAEARALLEALDADGSSEVP